jgi:S1-C subfamily serine protease
MVLVGGVVAVTPATAQVVVEREGPRTMEYTVTRRARLGVKVNLQARATDSLGAYVEAVTPGGPAEKAGIRSGDIITRVDGQSLLGGMAGVEEGSSLPGMKLIELAAKLRPNDTVSVDYRRGKEMRSGTLVTAGDDRYDVRIGPEGPRAFAFDFGDEFPLHMDRARRQLERMRVETGPGNVRVWMGGPLADLELAPINPDLGQYFGATEGVLVIDAPKESAFGLKGGDVVLAVDGRKPSSPGHLHRILQSYEGEESVRFEVLRNRKKQTVTGKMPKRDELQWKGAEPMRSRSRSSSPRGERVRIVREAPALEVLQTVL